jgi:tetratricopeptide (TPR) repeat protein
MSALDQWLDIAPRPPARDEGKQWDVFLSYRSTSRKWVLALYDAMRQLGYQTFLDQFVLDPSQRLVRALEQNLRKSQAGVLIWSSHSDDSEWCQREYETFEKLESEGAFRYVVVRLDTVPLPTFPSLKLWLDFSESREGPRGSNFLRLLYGLQGKPLPDKAVTLAARIDEDTKVQLASIRAARENGDKDRLLELSRADGLEWRISPLLQSEVGQSLISIGHHDPAIELLAQLEQAFPLSIRPKQLRALALARRGDWRQAKTILGELYELGERDPETIGVYARTWMDSYKATGDLLHLRRSRNLYAEACSLSPSDYYTCINAASKSILLGDFEAARRYAAQVEKLLGTQPKQNDYWKTATVAEVQLIKGNYKDAAKLYQSAVDMAPTRIDDHRSTWGQAKLLLQALRPSDAEVEGLKAAFAHLD